ncbi:MAG TPA: L,D-transpeptidase [Solirubrobacteraceae bacterium]|nr:L,D-transpeptidase [Solirubrobacteraceae bacterium]
MSVLVRTIRGAAGGRRAACALAAVLLASAITHPLVAPPSAVAARPPGVQRLATLLHDQTARSSPNVHARRVDYLAAHRPLTGVPTVLPVLGKPVRRGGSAWLHVEIPGRPNGRTGWIQAAKTRRSSTTWQLTVELGKSRVVVYRDGRVVRRFTAVIGKPATPTPRGRFFVEEALALSDQDAGGPFALATSARSTVLQEFEGGPGQIAIHGTHNISGALGTAVSHGCVRLDGAAITWLSQRIGAGVPMTITS